jgi:hypothetical protein
MCWHGRLESSFLHCASTSATSEPSETNGKGLAPPLVNWPGGQLSRARCICRRSEAVRPRAHHCRTWKQRQHGRLGEEIFANAALAVIRRPTWRLLRGTRFQESARRRDRSCLLLRADVSERKVTALYSGAQMAPGKRVIMSIISSQRPQRA